MIRGWTSRKDNEYWQSIHGQRQAKSFLRRPSAKRAGELLNQSRNQPSIMTGLLVGHCHLKGQLFKVELVQSTGSDWCKLAFETASHILCDCKAPVVLMIRHLGYHFLKPCDCWHLRQEGTPLYSKLGAAECLRKGLPKRWEMVMVPFLMYCSYCILFYSVLFHSRQTKWVWFIC